MKEKFTGDLFKAAAEEEAKRQRAEQDNPDNIVREKRQDSGVELDDSSGLSDQELAQMTPPAEKNPRASMFELYDEARIDAAKGREFMDARMLERRQKKLDFGDEKPKDEI